MANGDKATAAGWIIAAGTDDLRTGYDKINYVADRTAEQYTTLRDTVLPAINQPIFSVKRSSADLSPNSGAWTVATSGWWASPILNSGFASWSNGQLKVSKSGAHRLSAHVQFVGIKETVEIQVVKNTTSPDTANTIVKNSNGGRATTATDLVRLVAGDVLAVLVRTVGTENPVAPLPADLSFSAEWVRA